MREKAKDKLSRDAARGIVRLEGLTGVVVAHKASISLHNALLSPFLPAAHPFPLKCGAALPQRHEWKGWRGRNTK